MAGLIASPVSRTRLLLLVLCVQALMSANGLEATKVIWQIAKRDNSTLEFNNNWDFALRSDPQFVVGKSHPGQDWSDFQPGPADKAHGHRIHPFTVSFQLAGKPRGVFYLTIDVLFKVPGIPEYRVTLNGRTGRFYFRLYSAICG